MATDAAKASAVAAKSRGNQCFKQQDWQAAVAAFTEGLEFDDCNEVLYSNRSAGYSKLEQYEEAVRDAEKCIELKPEWAKGYGRRADALFSLQRYEEARESYLRGLQFDALNAKYKSNVGACDKALMDGVTPYDKAKDSSQKGKPSKEAIEELLYGKGRGMKDVLPESHNRNDDIAKNQNDYGQKKRIKP
jgi:tetratricopeptide (TPR) repeat protein